MWGPWQRDSCTSNDGGTCSLPNRGGKLQSETGGQSKGKQWNGNSRSKELKDSVLKGSPDSHV
jgi:hypothetical protein